MSRLLLIIWCVEMAEPQLDEIAEWTGHWWLPEDPDNIVPGMLEYEPGKGLRLSLVGGFEDRILRRENETCVSELEGVQTWAVIHGVAENKEVTLLDCLPISSKQYGWGSGLPDKQTVSAQSALIGVHLSGADQKVFTACHASIEDLTTWSGSSVFVTELGTTDGRVNGKAAMKACPLDDQSVTVDGVEITLARSHTLPNFEHQRGRTLARMQENAFIIFKPQNAWSIAEARGQVHAMRDLLSLATHRAAALLWMTLRMPPEDREYPKGFPIRDREIAVYTAQIVRGDKEAKTVEQRQTLFTCGHLPFEQIVPKWFEVRERNKAAANMVLGLRYSPEGFIETQLLSAVGAAEVLHRSLQIDEPPIPTEEFKRLRTELLAHVPEDRRAWFKRALGHNDPTLRDRLTALAKLPDREAMDRLVPDVESWSRAAVRARNNLAHEGHTPRQSFDELIAVVKVTSAVVVMNLLQQLGVPEERQREIVGNNSGLRHASDLADKWLNNEERD